MSSKGWYTGDATYDRVMATQLAIATFVLFGAFGNKKAPYGKFANKSIGSVQLDPRLGWWLMELPATLVFACTYFKSDPESDRKTEEERKSGKGPSRFLSKLFAALFLFHYANRGWYFPLNIRVAPGSKASFSLGNSAIGALITGLHGYLHARMFRTHGKHLNDDWVKDPRFISGFCLYELGFWITVHSEYVMRTLRKPGGPRYSIPRGGLFELVSSPQYFGELMAFAGLTLSSWSLPSLAIFLISFFNLVPRAFQNHTWYLKKFGDEYAQLNRRVIVPRLV
jgi:3-oxo-5-alpha-steroid 4-dehydrogenase 1